MNLCSACIVPVSAAFQRRGVGIEAGLAIVHGSSTLNLPGLVMAVLVFTPMMGVTRFLMGMTAVILVGTARRDDRPPFCQGSARTRTC